MSCQEDGAIVTDLIERFCDPEANQLAPWNPSLDDRCPANYQPDVVATTGVAVIIGTDF